MHEVEIRGSRWYEGDGLLVPSVTTILEAVNPGLDWWYARMGAEYVLDHQGDTIDRRALIKAASEAPEAYRDSKGVIGDHVHKWIEADLRGDPLPDVPKECESYIRQWQAFAGDHEILPRMIEVGVVSASGGYAGRLDGIAEIDGRLVLLDLKSGKSVRKKVMYQLAAYRYAERTFDGDPVPEVDGAVVLHIRPRSCRMTEVPAGPDQYRAFRYIREVYLLAEEMSERISG